ncbi:hypothetical protein D3C79_1089270 [compost metagenome]
MTIGQVLFRLGCKPQPLTDHGCGLATGIRQQDQELLAAIAEHHVHVAQLVFDRGGDRLEHVIACAVAMGIID